MSYYYFNKCYKKCLPEIKRTAKELGFIEIECPPPARFWQGEVLERQEEFDRTVLVSYNPKDKRPFVIQTSEPVTHKQKDFMALLQRFIEIVKPTEISDIFSQYDMGEFR